ncbi:MAG TPA: hypothetical protein VGD58_29915 [Herpetosiphonaceae bacterium]
MEVDVQSAATSKVYYPRNRKLMWLISGVLLLVSAGLLAYETSEVIAALFLLPGVYFLWYSFTTRLVISPAGIAFDSLGVYSVVTSWSNVERIVEIPSSTGGTIRVLMLRQPAATGWWYRDAALLPEHRGRAIPLSAPSWKQPRVSGRLGEIEEQIQHYTSQVLP